MFFVEQVLCCASIINALHKSREKLKTTGWSPARPRKALEQKIYTQSTSIVHLKRKLHVETWTS